MRRWTFQLGWRQASKSMMGFLPRLVPAALCVAALSFSALPALAQSGELRPADQQAGQSGTPADANKNGQKTNELAEAAAALDGLAGSAECVWVGRRVVRWLWQDDLDTAFRHLDLYDRFGCPANHVQATFRCVVRQGPFENKVPEGKPPEGKAADNLNSRVHACWINPGPANPNDAPAATTAHPARR
jgi:hypothetical protein